MGGVTDEVLLARAYLSRVAEPACVPLWGLVLEHGPVAVADAVRAGQVPRTIVSLTTARAAAADPHADLEAAERHGMRLVVPESDEWPHPAMTCLERTGRARLEGWKAKPEPSPKGELVPPLALWVRGNLSLSALSMRSVAIVGSRNATAYGDLVAKEFAYRLAARDFDVISGGALGIDSAAHRGALAAEGRTVAVSARGLDVPYPACNRSLFDRIAETGAIVSESPPGATPQRHRFLSRNRLIAAFGTGTVVVEAAFRSGALNTAGHCRALDRILMAVPGPITSAMSFGAHDLIRRGHPRAELVCRVADVLELIGGAGDVAAGLADELAERDASTTVRDRLDATSARVLEGFPLGRDVRADAVAVASGVPVTDVLGTLPLLTSLGLVASTGDDRYRLVAAPTAVAVEAAGVP